MIKSTTKHLLIWLALVIAAAINFFNQTILSFIVGTLITALFVGLIECLGVLIFKKIHNTFIAAGLVLLIVVGIAYGALIYWSNQQLCFAVVKPSGYRTNFVTRQCHYGSFNFGTLMNSCGASDRWYYTQGCSAEGKLKANPQ